MSITIPPAVAVTASAVIVATVPPGANTVVLSNTGANPAVIGTSNSVTATNGFPLPAGATVTITTVVGSRGATLWAFSTSGATVGVIISSAQ